MYVISPEGFCVDPIFNGCSSNRASVAGFSWWQIAQVNLYSAKLVLLALTLIWKPSIAFKYSSFCWVKSANDFSLIFRAPLRLIFFYVDFAVFKNKSDVVAFFEFKRVYYAFGDYDLFVFGAEFSGAHLDFFGAHSLLYFSDRLICFSTKYLVVDWK